LRGIGVSAPGRRLRAPHILSLSFKNLGFNDGIPTGLVEGLASEGIYVAARLGRMRISPHVFNDEADADRLVAALAKRLRG
jgi:selenocysteine lyase/cysteine desulfurase